MTKSRSVSDAHGRSAADAPNALKNEEECSPKIPVRSPSDALCAAMYAALVVPAALWSYDGRVVLAASAATFGAVYLFGRAIGLWRRVLTEKRKRPKVRYVEYVSRRPFDEERRLGYVSAEAICRAARGGRKE